MEWIDKGTNPLLCDSLQLQVQYGVLLLCAAKGGSWFCLVQEFEEMQVDGIPITNDYDCPLLNLTSCVRSITPLAIARSVSIVHECTNSCSFVQCQTRQRVERCSVLVHKLAFQHDFSNTLYGLNIYCMNVL